MNKRLLAVEKILENLFNEEAQKQLKTELRKGLISRSELEKPPTSELDEVNGR